MSEELKPCKCGAEIVGISDDSSVHSWRCSKCGHQWPRQITVRDLQVSYNLLLQRAYNDTARLAAAKAEIERLNAEINQTNSDVAGFVRDAAKLSESQQAHIERLKAELHDCVQAELAKDENNRELTKQITAQRKHIERLAGALREATEYVEATHSSLKGAVGHDNIVFPTLTRCKETLAALDRENPTEVEGQFGKNHHNLRKWYVGLEEK